MYSLGLDFGSTAVRALIIDLEKGTELSSFSTNYPCGTLGVCLDPEDPRLARQDPEAYISAMTESIRKAVALAKETDNSFSAEKLACIGVDATSATIIPVTENMQLLSRQEQFNGNHNAFSWMWKDHTSLEEAAQITSLAKKLHPEYLDRCGGSYSSEWFWSKTFHALRCDKEVFDAAYAWVELCDFIPALLAGLDDYTEIRCSAGAAGHKAMFAEEWGGLPDGEFLTLLDPELAKLRQRLYKKTYAGNEVAGYLSKEWAEKLSLIPGTPLDAGMIDAARSGDLQLEKLEAMTAVCSVGLDMIVVPGDTSAEVISGLIADEAAIGMVNSKTTAVRLIPAIGCNVGDTLEFGGLLGSGPVMPISNVDPGIFIKRGGQIPAPLQSLKN